MSQTNPLSIWNLNEKDLLNLLETSAFSSNRKEIRFYIPSFTYYRNGNYCNTKTEFPTISVTGNSCASNCKHCGGKVLETMYPVNSPEELLELGYKLKKNGAIGCLVSGGCLPDGSVPLEAFIPVLKRFKKDLGLTVFVHTGIIKLKSALALKEAEIDAALIDVVGSTETLDKICNLKITVEDYADSLKALQDAKLCFVPHVAVGLRDGKLDGELRALQIISRFRPSAVVIIAFMPIHGTVMSKVLPPKPIEIAKVSFLARHMFPDIPIVLGCMRPKGLNRGETDVLVLKTGVDAIAFPSKAAIDYAKSNGYKTVFSSYCCAQIYFDLIKK